MQDAGCMNQICIIDQFSISKDRGSGRHLWWYRGAVVIEAGRLWVMRGVGDPITTTTTYPRVTVAVPWSADRAW